MSFPIVVLVSGEGTNLQALIDRGLPLSAVASNRREAYALTRARGARIPTASFSLDCHADREERDLVMATWLEEHGVGLVVLAGYMHLLTEPFLRRFPGRIVNVHPSLLPQFPGAHAIDDVLGAGVATTGVTVHPALLPAFPGVHAIEQAVAAGVKVSGVTVHFVDEGVDSGPIILQRPFELPYPRDIAAIEDLVHEIEHELLPEVVRLIALGKVRVDPADPRWVVVDD